MSEHLISALDRNREEIESALADAERELERLEEREMELRTLIQRARAALGLATTVGVTARRLTLHEAIRLVLQEHGDGWMSVRDLAAEVNARDLYRRKDGAPVEANQVHARTKNYSKMFVKDGPRVRLA